MRLSIYLFRAHRPLDRTEADELIGAMHDGFQDYQTPVSSFIYDPLEDYLYDCVDIAPGSEALQPLRGYDVMQLYELDASSALTEMLRRFEPKERVNRGRKELRQ